MRKSTIAIGIAAALSTQAFVATTNADAAVKVKPLKSNSNTSHTLPHYVFPHHSPNGGGVLFDQSGSPVNGAPSQNFESSFDQYDAQAADDFVVTDAAGWTVSGFNFTTSLSTSPPGDPTTATYDIEVFPDNGGVPGATAACSYPALPGVLDGSQTALSVTLDSPCVLATGTYWISMVVNLDFAVGGQMFWSDFTGGSGANGKWQNPGGGFGTSCSSWDDLAVCGVGGSQTAFIFQVLGTVGGGGGGCGAGQLCLVSTVGTDTSPTACATTDTIDATVGDELNFCYTITNNTGIELDYHTLTNNVDGTLFTLLNQPVPNGGTFQYNNIETVSETATYNSTWTAQDVPPGYLSEVTGGGGGGCPDRIFADGFDPTPTPPCPPGGFVDITGTGTPLNNGDDQAIAVTMPFSFSFYGTTGNQICVDNNGFILFNTTACPTSGFFSNISLPATSLAAPAMMPMWDDFDSESGNVYTDTRGSAPNRQFIIEWFDRVHYSGSSNTDGATFELILNEDGTIQFEYLDVQFTGGLENADCSNGACATIGLQNDGTLFNQFSAFQPSVTDNSGILWTGTDPQVFQGTDSVTVNVGEPNIIVNNGNPITGSVGAGSTTTIPVPIQNTGDRDLDWTINEAGPADRHFPQGPARVAKPLGDVSKATLAPAPLALRQPHKGRVNQAQHAPNGVFLVPTFASDIYNNNYETFDASSPGATTTIAPTNGDAFVGGAFLDGDFSKQYVIIGQFGAGDFDEFGSVDTTTGVFTSIGSATNNLGEGYSGMSWDPVSGQLYAVSAACGSASHLWTIDPATGAATAVAEIQGVPCAIAIAINSAGQMYAIDIVNDALFAVNKADGSAALVGSIGFNANYAQDAAFDLSTDILYYAGFDGSAFTDQIYTVDLATGLATPVGNIGAGVQEVDAMSIATAGGPCSQPQDLPWLSFNPTSGTTAPGDTTNVSMGVDGTGSSDGDVLAGTMCTVSNDPDTRTVETSVTIDVTTGGGGGNVVDSGVLNYGINADFTGIYINWLTGCTITSDGGSCPEGTFFNAWSADGSTMSLFWTGTNVNMCVSTGGVCDVIHTGGTVGPGSTWSEGSATNFNAGVDACLGFQFVNANTATVNYGVVRLTTASPGFPATLVEYWYDNSGAAITAPAGCN